MPVSKIFNDFFCSFDADFGVALGEADTSALFTTGAGDEPVWFILPSKEYSGSITATATATTPSQTITNKIGSKRTEIFLAVSSVFVSYISPILTKVLAKLPDCSPVITSC